MTTTKNTQSEGSINKGFLNSIGDYKILILTNIASHYGISVQEAYNEVTHDEAENIIDYIYGSKSKYKAMALYNKYLNN